MANIEDYDEYSVKRCFTVLIELLTILGEYRENLVLVGGWVAKLSLDSAEEPHIGTTDVDLAVDFQNIPDTTYETIVRLLLERGYRQDDNQPYKFFRKLDDGMEVEVDFLAGEYGGTGKSRRHQRVQDLRARKARAADLVFDNFMKLTITGELPNGAKNEVTLKVASIVSFLAMKGMAIWDRYDEKDSYDICYTIRNYPGGLHELAEVIKPHLGNRLILEGLQKIRAKFKEIDGLGPAAYADFLLAADIEERQLLIRDAYERVNSLLDELGVEPYEEVLD
ncbi:MAG: hypothetical protein HPY75_03715 [Actinobacteria bacterium]|nr:hypothetical protein [Actinomycetota bacterium]